MKKNFYFEIYIYIDDEINIGEILPIKSDKSVYELRVNCRMLNMMIKI